jgi:hypothetical protein
MPPAFVQRPAPIIQGSNFLTVDSYCLETVGNTLSSVVYAQHRIDCIDDNDETKESTMTIYLYTWCSCDDIKHVIQMIPVLMHPIRIY